MDINRVNSTNFSYEEERKDIKKSEEEDKSLFVNSSFSKSSNITSIEAQLLELQEDLSSTTSQDQRDRINAQIQAVRQQQRQEIIRQEVDNYLANSNLPKNIASELVNLTLEAINTLDIAQKNVIDAHIQSLAKAYDIDENEMAKLKPLNDMVRNFALEDLDTQQISIDTSFNKQLSTLEEELKSTSDRNSQMAIKAQIYALTQAHHREMMEIEGQRFMFDTNLPKDVASELLSLTMEKADAEDMDRMELINARISLLVEKYNIDDEELAKLVPLNNEIFGYKKGNIDIERESNNAYFSSQMEQLEKQLSYVSDEGQKSAILAMMEQLERQNTIENDRLDLKTLELQYSMQLPTLDEKGLRHLEEKKNLLEMLSQCTDKEQREKIQADIQKLDTEYESMQ